MKMESPATRTNPYVIGVLIFALLFLFFIGLPTLLVGRDIGINGTSGVYNINRYSEHIGDLSDLSTYDCEGLVQMLSMNWFSRPLIAPSEASLKLAIEHKRCEI